MPARYARFEIENRSAFGELENGAIFEFRGDLFGTRDRTGVEHRLDSVTLLPPCQPTKILGVGLNYRSHLGGRKAPTTPELFYKPVSALAASGQPIVIPRGATDVHFEGELVMVIGKRLKAVTSDEAADGIFGVSCGNDVSDRGWQRGENKDLQWWRAKGCDTFAPLGPVIATGLDYNNLKLETRVNGQTAQSGSSSDLIHDCSSVVSWASQWITLEPGDLIYTGTPGNTFALQGGDVVEVEIEGIGMLRNRVR